MGWKTHSRHRVFLENVVSHHDDQSYGGAVGTFGQIPVTPDKMFDSKRSCLFSELATKSSIAGDDHRNPIALNKRGAKDGNRLPGAGGEDGNDGLMFACQDTTKEKSLVFAGKGAVSALCVK